VLLKSLEVRFQQPKYFLRIQGRYACCPQADNETLLPVHQTLCFNNVFLHPAKVIFKAHAVLTLADKITPLIEGASD
jgi:hypothetical protein